MIRWVDNMEKKRIVTIIIAAIVLLGVGYGGYFYYETKVEQANASTLTLHGNVDVREVDVAFRQSDRIDKIYVTEGDTVKAGQLLAELDSTELKLSISKDKSQIAAQQATVSKLLNGTRSEEIEQAQANVDSARATANQAQTSYARLQSLYDQDAISAQQRDDAQATADAAQAKLAYAEKVLQEAAAGSRQEDIVQAEATLQYYKDELARQEYVLSNYQLVAPSDGVIRSRLLEVGDMASTTRPVFKLSLNDKKWARVYVKETDLPKIFEGQEAKIYLDGRTEPIIGQIGYISGTAEFTPKTVQTDELRTSLVYEVRVYADDPDNVLRLGMPTTVKIAL